MIFQVRVITNGLVLWHAGSETYFADAAAMAVHIEMLTTARAAGAPVAGTDPRRWIPEPIESVR